MLKMTLKDFEELNPIGRFFTAFYHGQSCINCNYLIKGECVNQEHIKAFTYKFGNPAPFKISFYQSGYEKDDDLFRVGSKCDHWELIKPWEKKHWEKRK